MDDKQEMLLSAYERGDWEEFERLLREIEQEQEQEDEIVAEEVEEEAPAYLYDMYEIAHTVGELAASLAGSILEDEFEEVTNDLARALDERDVAAVEVAMDDLRALAELAREMLLIPPDVLLEEEMAEEEEEVVEAVEEDEEYERVEINDDVLEYYEYRKTFSLFSDASAYCAAIPVPTLIIQTSAGYEIWASKRS